MTTEFISSKAGLIEIQIECMKCGNLIKANVEPGFKRKLRKWCGPCRKIMGLVSTFEDNLTDGCRRINCK